MKTIERMREWFQENIVKRKVIFFAVIFTAWVALLFGAYTSPKRQVYTQEQLMTKRSFSNGTGEIEITSQTYSPKTGIIVLEIETSDMTSSVERGIDPNRLEWKLYSPNPSSETSMEVIPVSDKKISVIIRNVPKNFGVFAMDIKNKSVKLNDVNVDISSSSDEEKTTTKKASGEDTVQFFVATQNDKLKTKTIKNISREDFALAEIKKEKDFQKGQKKQLNDAIKKIKDSISDDENTKVSYQEEAKYLTGDDLTNNQKNIDTVDTSIQNKNEQIATASDNVSKVNERITALEKKEKAIKNGTFEFSNAIQTIKMK